MIAKLDTRNTVFKTLNFKHTNGNKMTNRVNKFSLKHPMKYDTDNISHIHWPLKHPCLLVLIPVRLRTVIFLIEVWLIPVPRYTSLVYQATNSKVPEINAFTQSYTLCILWINKHVRCLESNGYVTEYITARLLPLIDLQDVNVKLPDCVSGTVN